MVHRRGESSRKQAIWVDLGNLERISRVFSRKLPVNISSASSIITKDTFLIIKVSLLIISQTLPWGSNYQVHPPTHANDVLAYRRASGAAVGKYDFDNDSIEREC